LCGIFGFALKKPISLARVFGLLEQLESHQYPEEPKPVGGYGAGIAFLKADGTVFLEKVGRVEDSPARHLSRIVEFDEARVLVGHVRFPSEQFKETSRFRETAQPYVARCSSGLTVVSVHNGYVENYEDIRRGLGEGHAFESGSIGLVDSEVIPHLFEEMMIEHGDVDDALDAVFAVLQGVSAACLLQTGREGMFLHFIHKGKTRGLTVWTNGDDEILFCSRKELVATHFGDLLNQGEFNEKVSVPWRTEAELKLSFPIRAVR
jgi:glucosamine 6-phosphate synthetase-like amidotransferase/phosphosugar isomerase protein